MACERCVQRHFQLEIPGWFGQLYSAERSKKKKTAKSSVVPSQRIFFFSTFQPAICDTPQGSPSNIFAACLSPLSCH